ncbi:MFS transporter [Kitasatospora cinereorecta]|uniref:MFS transporter n=1 Tax=Kitasatospora cinereorecta TaxID=285560 RepID=A0ABW0V612_9ACTN
MRVINRDYTALLAGQAVSQAGDFVFDTTLALWVGTRLLEGRSYAPAAVAGLLAADAVRAVLIGLLAVLAFLPPGTLGTGPTVVVVYAVVFLATGVAQFFNPAKFAVIAQVVDPADRTRAAALGQSTQAIASIAGPPLAAPLLIGLGPGWALVINAGSFVVSYLLVRTVRPRPVAAPAGAGAGAGEGPGEGFLAELVSGLRVAFGSPTVRVLLVTLVLVALGVDALNSLNVFFVAENLHTDARWLGTLEMATGLGLVAGVVVATRLGGRIGHWRALWLSLLLIGAGLVGYSRLSSLGAALVLMFLLGVPVAVLNTAFSPVLLAAVPSSHLGRVVAVVNPVQHLANLVGVTVAGWLASTVLRDFHTEVAGVQLGRIDTVLAGAGLLVVAGGVYAALAGERTPVPAAAAVVPAAD